MYAIGASVVVAIVIRLWSRFANPFRGAAGWWSSCDESYFQMELTGSPSPVSSDGQ